MPETSTSNGKAKALFFASFSIFGVTSLFLLIMLDAGAREASMPLYVFSPLLILLGASLCIAAYRLRRPWTGLYGLLLVCFWYVYTLSLKIVAPGVVRQSILGTMDILFISLGLWFAYGAWKEIRHASSSPESRGHAT